MSYKGITLVQIEYFLAVAVHLSFTEAAKRMYTTQPSLSRQISQMERQLGVELFYRDKKAIRMTVEGIVLYNELEGITAHIDNGLRSCVNIVPAQGSSLSIGCHEAMDTGVFLKEIICEFKQAYPNIEITIERDGFRELHKKMLSGELDAIFTLSFEVDQTPGVMWDEVYRHNTCILMAADHPQAGKEGLELGDFKEEIFVLLNRDQSPKGYDSIMKHCKKHGFIPKQVKHVPNVESLLLTIESGDGVAVLDSNIRTFTKSNFWKCYLDNDYIDEVMAWKPDAFNATAALFHKYVMRKIKSPGGSK